MQTDDADDRWLVEQKRARRRAYALIEATMPSDTKKRIVIRRKRGQVLVSIDDVNAIATDVASALRFHGLKLA